MPPCCKTEDAPLEGTQEAAVPPSDSAPPAAAPLGDAAGDLRPCCACPETRRKRDDCMLLAGSEEHCSDFIDAHIACLRAYGFETLHSGTA